MSSRPVDLRVAIVVNPSMGIGLLANTVATIAIGLGATDGRLGGPVLVDRSGVSVHPSASIPVPVLQATGDVLSGLVRRAVGTERDDTAVVPFPRFARTIHDFASYRSAFDDRDLRAEDIDGIGLLGPRRWVASLTGSLKLLA